MSERAAEDLKREMERQMSAAAESRDRFLSQLSETASASAGLESVGEEPAMTVLKDTSLPEETRVEVIARLGAGITRRDDYIEVLLAIVQDAGDAAPVRAAALQALGSAAFQVARFRPHEQAYQRALRNLAGDQDASLREAAVAILAAHHDPEIQQTLRAGLEGRGPLPVGREQAIQLLAEDDHLDNLPLLRELYEGGAEDARQEAVRLMGSYASASDTLAGVLRDKGETAEVRQQAAASLRNLAPERFEALAKEIATDSSDDPDVRRASLHTLQHLGDSERVHRDAEFISRLETVGGEESAPDVAQGARDFIERLPDR